MNAMLATLCASLWWGVPQKAQAPAVAAPPATADVSLLDRLGERVPLDVTLVDHLGRRVELNALLDGTLPLVLVPAYYRCPMLCGLTIEGVANAMAAVELVPGEDYRVATVSFDPRDGPADAERARARAVDLHGGTLSAEAWPFLTGESAEVRRLTDAVGFRFAWDEDTEQYAHGSAVFVLSPDGKLTRVLYGLQYEPLDLRLALLEAGEGKVGSFAEQIILTCYRYDPTARRYGFWVFGFLRIAGLVMLTMLGLGFVVIWRRDRRRTRRFANDPEVRR